MYRHITPALVAAMALSLVACGGDNSDEKTNKTEKTGAVKIASFEVSPGEIAAGEAAQLRWKVMGPEGTKITIGDGSETLVDGSDVLLGSHSVGAVSADTTYTLTARAGEDTATQTATLKVKAKTSPTLVIHSFTGPKQVDEGAKAELRWRVSGPAGTTVTIQSGDEVLVAKGDRLEGKVSTGALTAARSYTLIAAGGGKELKQTLDVSVNVRMRPVIQSFTGSQGIEMQIIWGGYEQKPIELKWDVNTADRVVLTDEAGTELVASEKLSDTFEWAMPQQVYRQTITLTATKGEGDNAVSTTATVDVGIGGYIFESNYSPIFLSEAGAEDVSFSWKAVGEVTLQRVGGAQVPVPAGQSEVKVSTSEPGDYLLTATQFGVSVTKSFKVEQGVKYAARRPGDRLITGAAPTSDALVFEYELAAGDFIEALATNADRSGCAAAVQITNRAGEAVGSKGKTDCYWTFDDAPAGTYQVRLTALEGVSDPYYLQVGIVHATCGDGFVTRQTGEQCDDKNTVAGDGCDASCQREIIGTPMNVGETRTISLAAKQIGYVQLRSDADRMVMIQTAAPAGATCRDTQLALMDAQGNPFITRANPCIGFPTLLGSGDYLVGLMDAEGAVTDVQLSVTDLGATFASTSTGGAFNVQTYDQLPGVVLLTLNQTTSLGVKTTGACDADFYNGLFVARRDRYSDLTGFAHNVRGAALAEASTSTQGDCPEMSGRIDRRLVELPAGEYIVGYANYNGTEGAPAAPNIKRAGLEVQLIVPGCGNDVIESTEACDDGNTAGGDLCSATCTWSGLTEAEPNNNQADAQELASLPAMVRSALHNNPAADVDVYTFTLTARSTVTAWVGGSSPTQCTGDTYLYLQDGTYTEIATDDDGGAGKCSKIERVLDAGTYYVAVQAYMSLEFDPYFLSVSATPAP